MVAILLAAAISAKNLAATSVAPPGDAAAEVSVAY
jgi:hypothetical protein